MCQLIERIESLLVPPGLLVVTLALLAVAGALLVVTLALTTAET